MTQFASDRTSSNKAGVTLMNNQVGYVVADVMRDKEDVTVTELPSMIRVDGVNKVDFDYEEIAEALGLGRLRQRRLRRDHVDPLRAYGRPRRSRPAVREPGGRGRVHRLRPPARRSRRRAACTRRTARSTSSSTATCTSGTRARRTGCQGHEEYAKGWIECFHAYQGLGPAETHWTLEHFQKYSVEDFEKDVFEEGHVDMAVVPVDVPEGVVHERLQRHRAERRAARPLPGQADRSTAAGTRVRARPACASSRPTTPSTASRASSSTRPSGTRARAAGS